MLKLSSGLAAVAVAMAMLAPASPVQAAPVADECGTHPTHYLRTGSAANEAKTYIGTVNINNIDLTFEMTLSGGYKPATGDIVSMQAKTTVRTTNAEDERFTDTSFFGGWEVNSNKSGVGTLRVKDPDGEWIKVDPVCDGISNNAFVTRLKGTLTILGFHGGRIGEADFTLNQSGAAALPW